MSWISTQFYRHWRNIHVGAIVVLVAGLALGPQAATGFLSQSILRGFYYPFFKIKSTYELLASQEVANAELRASLTKASLRITQLEEAQRDNLRLRAALGFEPPPGYRLIPAEVVSVFGHRLPTAAIINRGADNDVFLNLPVINQDGLIGRISTMDPSFATVQLLTDPANRVAARVASSREMGIVKFTSAEGMTLANFPLHGVIIVGDTVVSSGLGGVYPAGLTVGVVTLVERDEDYPFCRVLLEPAANFQAIEELFVLGTEDLP